jgi:hypothetical protein
LAFDPNTTADAEKEEEMPYSVVLLLRSLKALSEDDLRFAAEQGWQKSFDGKHDPMFFVFVSGEHASVKAGKHVIKVPSVGEPYLGDPSEIAQQLPRDDQKIAWLNHRAWFALDFWNLDMPKADAYEMLARLALPLLDQACCGVFLPKEEVFMPDNGLAEEGLHLLLERHFF